jgi:hypothetical protein
MRILTALSTLVLAAVAMGPRPAPAIATTVAAAQALAVLGGRIVAVAPDVPVSVWRYDGHMIVVNSMVMKLAGITAQTRDPVGGEIVRDAKGEPTGALKDSAVDLVTYVIPILSKAQRRTILERALKYATSVGSRACRI